MIKIWSDTVLAEDFVSLRYCTLLLFNSENQTTTSRYSLEVEPSSGEVLTAVLENGMLNNTIPGTGRILVLYRILQTVYQRHKCDIKMSKVTTAALQFCVYTSAKIRNMFFGTN